MKKDLFNYDFLCTNPLNQYSQINPTTGTAINLEYDNNGSLLSNQRLSNEWNEENQLEIIIDQDKGSRSEYLYDGYGRRTQRTDYNSTVGGSASAIIRYLYEGWNCIADYTIEGNSATLSKSYTWGLDLSGSMQGAGGVGGLLSITDHSEGNTHSVSYDGNGNIVDLITQEGEVSAHYEYDPFGNTLVKNGAFAEENNYRFSTKPINTHAGELYYYGYRYYDPEVGRWLNRDPIEEEGGYNLYGFVGNDGVNWVDVLGLHFEQDSAGRWCCPDSMQEIRLQAYIDEGLGHVSIGYTETYVLRGIERSFNRAWGLYPRQNGGNWFSTAISDIGLLAGAFLLDNTPGEIIDNTNTTQRSHPDLSHSYTACPITLRLLKASIDQSRRLEREGRLFYNLGNNNGFNCVGWACHVLQTSGITPSVDPYTSFLGPSNLGRLDAYDGIEPFSGVQ